MSKRSSKLFYLPGQVSVRSLVAAAVLAGLSGLAIAGKYDGYKPNAFVGRMVSEADVFEEAMVKGTSEGILTGETAKLMQQKLQVTTPIRMKATKGEVDAKGCQVMITSMWVRDIHAPAMGVDKGDYVFTNKLTLCKDKSSPIVEVLSCDFAGRSCMPL